MAPRNGHLQLKKGDVVHDKYEILDAIGCGNFSKVYRCWDTKAEYSTRKAPCLAMKVIKKDHVKDARCELNMLRILNAKDPNHDSHVCHLYDAFEFRGYPVLVMSIHGAPLCTRRLGLRPGGLTRHLLLTLCYDLLETVRFLHFKCLMVHTDLKPENILMCNDTNELPSRPSTFFGEHWVVCDFGSSSLWRLEKLDSDLISTRPYRAPEVILGNGWHYAVDIWSLGCIFYEVATGRRLFEIHDDNSHLQLMSKIIGKMPELLTKSSRYSSYFFNARGEFSTSSHIVAHSRSHVKKIKDTFASDPAFAALLLAMLTYDPQKRATAAEAMLLPIFDRIRVSREAAALKTTAAARRAPAAALHSTASHESKQDTDDNRSTMEDTCSTTEHNSLGKTNRDDRHGHAHCRATLTATPTGSSLESISHEPNYRDENKGDTDTDDDDDDDNDDMESKPTHAFKHRKEPIHSNTMQTCTSEAVSGPPGLTRSSSSLPPSPLPSSVTRSISSHALDGAATDTAAEGNAKSSCTNDSMPPDPFHQVRSRESNGSKSSLHQMASKDGNHTCATVRHDDNHTRRDAQRAKSRTNFSSGANSTSQSHTATMTQTIGNIASRVNRTAACAARASSPLQRCSRSVSEAPSRTVPTHVTEINHIPIHTMDTNTHHDDDDGYHDDDALHKHVVIQPDTDSHMSPSSQSTLPLNAPHALPSASRTIATNVKVNYNDTTTRHDRTIASLIEQQQQQQQPYQQQQQNHWQQKQQTVSPTQHKIAETAHRKHSPRAVTHSAASTSPTGADVATSAPVCSRATVSSSAHTLWSTESMMQLPLPSMMIDTARPRSAAAAPASSLSSSSCRSMESARSTALQSVPEETLSVLTRPSTANLPEDSPPPAMTSSLPPATRTTMTSPPPLLPLPLSLSLSTGGPEKVHRLYSTKLVPAGQLLGGGERDASCVPCTVPTLSQRVTGAALSVSAHRQNDDTSRRRRCNSMSSSALSHSLVCVASTASVAAANGLKASSTHERVDPDSLHTRPTEASDDNNHSNNNRNTFGACAHCRQRDATVRSAREAACTHTPRMRARKRKMTRESQSGELSASAMDSSVAHTKPLTGSTRNAHNDAETEKDWMPPQVVRARRRRSPPSASAVHVSSMANTPMMATAALPAAASIVAPSPPLTSFDLPRVGGRVTGAAPGHSGRDSTTALSSTWTATVNGSSLAAKQIAETCDVVNRPGAKQAVTFCVTHADDGRGPSNTQYHGRNEGNKHAPAAVATTSSLSTAAAAATSASLATVATATSSASLSAVTTGQTNRKDNDLEERGGAGTRTHVPQLGNRSQDMLPANSGGDVQHPDKNSKTSVWVTLSDSIRHDVEAKHESGVLIAEHRHVPTDNDVANETSHASIPSGGTHVPLDSYPREDTQSHALQTRSTHDAPKHTPPHGPQASREDAKDVTRAVVLTVPREGDVVAPIPITNTNTTAPIAQHTASPFRRTSRTNPAHGIDEATAHLTLSSAPALLAEADDASQAMTAVALPATVTHTSVQVTHPIASHDTVCSNGIHNETRNSLDVHALCAGMHEADGNDPVSQTMATTTSSFMPAESAGAEQNTTKPPAPLVSSVLTSVAVPPQSVIITSQPSMYTGASTSAVEQHGAAASSCVVDSAKSRLLSQRPCVKNGSAKTPRTTSAVIVPPAPPRLRREALMHPLQPPPPPPQLSDADMVQPPPRSPRKAKKDNDTNAHTTTTTITTMIQMPMSASTLPSSENAAHTAEEPVVRRQRTTPTRRASSVERVERPRCATRPRARTPAIAATHVHHRCITPSHYAKTTKQSAATTTDVAHVAASWNAGRLEEKEDSNNEDEACGKEAALALSHSWLSAPTSPNGISTRVSTSATMTNATNTSTTATSAISTAQTWSRRMLERNSGQLALPAVHVTRVVKQRAPMSADTTAASVSVSAASAWAGSDTAVRRVSQKMHHGTDGWDDRLSVTQQTPPPPSTLARSCPSAVTEDVRSRTRHREDVAARAQRRAAPNAPTALTTRQSTSCASYAQISHGFVRDIAALKRRNVAALSTMKNTRADQEEHSVKGAHEMGSTADEEGHVTGTDELDRPLVNPLGRGSENGTRLPRAVSFPASEQRAGKCRAVGKGVTVPVTVEIAVHWDDVKYAMMRSAKKTAMTHVDAVHDAS